MKIIERDLGSQPNNMSLDEGHTGHGCDRLIELNEYNRFTDDIMGGAIHEEIRDGVHRLPQAWQWICSWRVHKGAGGPNTQKDDVAEIKEPVAQTFQFTYKRNVQNVIVGVTGEIEKFGCYVKRSSSDNNNTYLGPRESDPPQQ